MLEQELFSSLRESRTLLGLPPVISCPLKLAQPAHFLHKDSDSESGLNTQEVEDCEFCLKSKKA